MPDPFSVKNQDDQNAMPPGMIGLPKWMLPSAPQTPLATPAQPAMAGQPAPTPNPSPTPSPVTSDPASGMPITPSAPATAPLALSPASAELTRLTQRSPASMAGGKYDVTQDQSRSGIEQIHNPFLRTLGRIGDVALSSLLPAAAVFTPGTQLHHQMNVNSARNAVADEESEAEESRKALAAPVNRADVASQTALRNAQAQKALEPPEKVKDEQLLYDKNGTPIGYRDDAGKYYGPEDPALPSGVKDVLAAAKTKAIKESAHIEKSDDGSIYAFTEQPDGSFKKETLIQGSGGKMPKLSAEERGYMKAAGGDPDDEKTWTAQVMQKYAAVKQPPQRAPIVNVGAEDFQKGEKGRELLDKAEASYRAAAQGAQTLTDFVNSAKAGNKVTAQALPLEGTLEITTTAGTKRINRAEVDQYAGAGSLFDSIMGRIGKLKAGQPTPPDVMDDSVKLAKILQGNAYKTYKDAHDSAVKRYGLKGEDPLPDPGGAQPKVGDTKTFPNGKTGKFDGQGWVAQ